MTAPTPAIAPSTSSERRSPGGSAPLTRFESQATPASIHDFGVSLHANTAWNMTNMTSARMTGPSSGWSSTASSRWVQRRTGVSLTTALVAISRARR